jgi:hypothetical protein
MGHTAAGVSLVPEGEGPRAPGHLRWGRRCLRSILVGEGAQRVDIDRLRELVTPDNLV